MKEILLRGARSNSRIIIGTDLPPLTHFFLGKKPIYITDRNIVGALPKLFNGADPIVLEPGEGSKSLKSVEYILSECFKRKVERKDVVVGVGGGVMTDIAGFAASIYLRGLECGFAATSLLAMVDAAVGGKNGVDFQGVKNLIGTLTQPSFCACDTSWLATLPKREFTNGMAEVIKAAIIGDEELFEFLEKNHLRVETRDRATLLFVIEHAVNVKRSIVEADEFEGSIRRKLNLGHTLGHAIEQVCDLLHGEAVAVGTCFASRLSVERGSLSVAKEQRIANLLRLYGLPQTAQANPEKLLHFMAYDKKRAGDSIHMILPLDTGGVGIELIALDTLKAALQKSFG
jgi:3-dehydroquinate synthase